MIDFQNAVFVKLSSVHDKTFADQIQPMFVDGEEIVGTYQGVRDGVVFTNKRIIAINIQARSSPSRWKLQAALIWTAS